MAAGAAVKGAPIVVLGLLALAAAVARPSQGRDEGFRVRTLATFRAPVAAFAQNDRYLAWITKRGLRGSCGALSMHDLRTGRRTSIRRRCRIGDGDPASLVLAGDRAYWDEQGGSNLTEYAVLMTASMRDRRVRQIGYQSIPSEGFQRLVPVASDGRSAYFWTSPQDATPGPLVRFDGLRRTKVTATISRLNALGAGHGSYAFALAIPRYDCAQEPDWAPDSSEMIAFSSGNGSMWYRGRRNCRGGLWVKAASEKPRRVAEYGRNPDWSREYKLAYEDEKGAVVVSDSNGRDARVVVARGAQPAWSPDATRLAFSRDQAIFVVAADGSGERLVTTGAVEPDWAPDGSRLVFTRTDAANPGLGIVRLGDGEVRSLTTGSDRQPAWSPDGRLIAYAHCTGSHAACPGDETRIYVVAPDGTGVTARTSDSDETTDLAPSWGHSLGVGPQLVFSRSRAWQDDGDSHIVVLSNRRATRLTHTPPPETPVVVRSRTGRTLGRPTPSGEAVELAVTRRATAALVRGQTWRVDVFTPTRETVNLGERSSAGSLAAAGQMLVFRAGRRTIMFLHATGFLAEVARAPSAPIGLTIVGRRIAWAENVRGRGRIRAVTVPRRIAFEPALASGGSWATE